MELPAGFVVSLMQCNNTFQIPQEKKKNILLMKARSGGHFSSLLHVQGTFSKLTWNKPKEITITVHYKKKGMAIRRFNQKINFQKHALMQEHWETNQHLRLLVASPKHLIPLMLLFDKVRAPLHGPSWVGQTQVPQSVMSTALIQQAANLQTPHLRAQTFKTTS